MTGLDALEVLARRLDPGPEDREALAGAVLAYAGAVYRDLPEAPAFVLQDRPGAGLTAAPPTESGRPLAEVLDLLRTQVDGPGAHGGSGRHFAFIPPSTSLAGAFGDFLAALTNKYAGYHFAGPGAVRMEHQVLGWMARELGFPAGTRGNLAGGGSLAHLVGICAAREAAGLRAADTDKVCIYASDQAHHCLAKALRVAGLGEAKLRAVPSDAAFRMRVDLLDRAIRADRAAGLRPWLLAPTAGTTNSGAVDPLADCAGLAARHGLWLHTDGAYGAFFALCGPGRAVLAGLEAADSLVADPHKGLFAPMGTGAVLVRHLEPLRRAHAYAADYLPDPPEDPEELSPTEVTLEFSKHARALRLWLPLQLYGAAPFRAALEEKLALAALAWDLLAALPDLEPVAAPQLSVMAFRFRPRSGDADAFNQAILARTQKEGRVFLSGTRLAGAFCLRLAVLALRSHRAEVEEAVAALARAHAAEREA